MLNYKIFPVFMFLISVHLTLPKFNFQKLLKNFKVAVLS